MPIVAFNVYEKVSTFNADVRRKLNEIIEAVNAGGGGGSVAAQVATIDFGAFAYDAKATVVDATVTSSTKIIASLTIAGRDADELEMAPIVLSTYVTDGVGFDIYAHALQGADGQFKVNYMKV